MISFLILFLMAIVASYSDQCSPKYSIIRHYPFSAIIRDNNSHKKFSCSSIYDGRLQTHKCKLGMEFREYLKDNPIFTVEISEIDQLDLSTRYVKSDILYFPVA